MVLFSRQMVLGLLTLLCFVACESTKPQYADPNEEETLTLGFGRSDIKKCVKTLYNKFVKVDPKDWSPPGKDRPYIAVRRVKNMSDEHVDTKMVTNLLTEELLNSGQFRFTTELENKATLVDEIEEQSESGAFKQNQRTAKKGNWNPPEYFLTGRFSSIRKKKEGVEDVYFVFVLNLDAVNTATTVWTGSREIAKIKERGSFGY